MNFRVQMARGGSLRAKKEDVHCAASPTDLRKTLVFIRETRILGNRSFATQDGWDRFLEPLLDVLGPLRRGQGERFHASARHCLDVGGFGGHEPEL